MRPYPPCHGKSQAGQRGAAPPCRSDAARRCAEPALEHHGRRRRRHHRRRRGTGCLRGKGASRAPRRIHDQWDDRDLGQQRPGRRRDELPEFAQPAVDADAVRTCSRTRHQRLELMPERSHPADTQRVYRTRALGTIAEVVVTDAGSLVAASELLQLELERIDRVASRFRDDSELSRLNEASGHRDPGQCRPPRGIAGGARHGGGHRGPGRSDGRCRAGPTGLRP